MSTRVEPVSEALLVERVAEVVLAVAGGPAHLPAGGQADVAAPVRALVDGHPSTHPERLADELVAARRLSTNPGYARAIARMAETLAWRLQAQGLIAETPTGDWRTTPEGRDLISCTGAGA